MARRDLPEINAGSMADIAFLLLIFFLVATTMDTDSGIYKILSHPSNDETPPPEVRERNILVVLVNRNDQVMIEGKLSQLKDVRKITTEFLLNESYDENLPEKKIENIEFLGELEVTKGIISLQTDRGTSYQIFVSVLNEIMAAGNEIKDKFSLKHFGVAYNDLPKEKQKAVVEAVPCVISEAEPRNIGGN